MAIYDAGTASLASDGTVSGVGTTWRQPLTLIRVGATMIFNTTPASIVTIAEILSDTEIRVFNDKGFTAPAGTQYSILAHDGITVQGLAQDVAETLRYYQSRETEVAAAVDAFNNLDINDFNSKVSSVKEKSDQVSSDLDSVIAAKNSVDASLTQVQTYAAQANSSATEALNYSNDAMSYAASAQSAASSVQGALVINFTDGGEVQSKSQAVLMFNGDGTYSSYLWGGALPKQVPPNSTPESTGGISQSSWISNGRIDKSRPEFYGAIGDGVNDDTAAIQELFNSQRRIDMSGNKNWVISSEVVIPDRTEVYFGSSIITANVPGGNIFSFSGKDFGLKMEASGGVIRGTASCFLYLNGSSDTPVNSDYVRNVRLYGITVSSTTINTSIIMNKAVRKVFIDSCDFYTINGIISNGKGVEVAITKSIIYSSGSSSNTDSFGIRLTSSGGTRYYNEGWHITDCTIDNFTYTIDLLDVFVFTINGGFIATNFDNGYAVSVKGPTTTTHCREIQIRSVIGGKVRFFDRATSTATIASISGEITNCKPGTCLSIGSNIAGIDVYDLRVTSSPDCTLMSVSNNAANIQIRGISTDSSLTSGIIFNGENGSGCMISDFHYAGSGIAMSLARPVRISNVPLTSDTALYKVRNGYVSTSFDCPVGTSIASTAFSAAYGSMINIDLSLILTGVATGNAQYLNLSCPSGVILPNGSNSMSIILPSSGSPGMSYVSGVVTRDFKNEAFNLTNSAGSQLRVLVGTNISVSIAN